MASGCISHAVPQPAVCETCARHAAARRRRKRHALVAIALLVPIGAAVAYLQTRPPPPAPPAQEPDPVLRQESARLAKAPCDGPTLSARVDRLAELGRLPEALDTAYRAVGCGVRGRMRWRISYLNRQLHRWFPAVVIETELITETPDDSDFWWWRGAAYADGGLPRLAVIDDRQSLANSWRAQAAGFAAARIGAPARAAGEPCEADRAWRYYVHALGGEPSQDMRDDHAALVRARTCDREDGTGAGRLGARVRVTIDGVTGTFEVDPRAGTTLVSRMFAGRIGLESDPHRLGTAMVQGRPVLGEPARLDRVAAGPVAASVVDALVVDNLPADGVLGLSFLWHFAWTEVPGGFHLAPPDREPL